CCGVTPGISSTLTPPSYPLERSLLAPRSVTSPTNCRSSGPKCSARRC
ncbi:MAG: hypothetical protein AVDCRST_MAG14-124, partial [uncultured Rubrobacteraceae bacterium]